MTNTEIVQAAYAAFGQGDMPGLLAHVDADVQWDHAGPDVIPWAGSFRGHDGVMQFFGAIGQNCEFNEFAPQTFLADGDKVVVIGTEKVTYKPTGRTFEVNWTHVHTLNDGKVVAFREYTDTAAIAAACTAK